MPRPYYQVSRDSARALEEFSTEFRDALVLGESTPWASALGFARTSNALKTTFPLPISAAGYHEFKGDMKYRSIYERSLSMTSRLWQDGVAELARFVESDQFADWAGEPARIANEWTRLPQVIVADMLALGSLDGPLLDLYRDNDTDGASTRRLFATDHPFNVLKPGLGTFNNTMQTTLAKIESGEFFEELGTHFRSIKGANGQYLGLTATGGQLLVPSTREQFFKRALEQETVIRALQNVGATENVAAVTQRNRFMNYPFMVADELANQNHLYAFAAQKAGLHPWVIQSNGAPEEIRHDKTSEMYKSQLKIGVSYVGEMEAAAAMPHRIVRVEITG